MSGDGKTMEKKQRLWERLKSYLRYGSIRKEEYKQVQEPVGKSRMNSLTDFFNACFPYAGFRENIDIQASE